MPLSIARRTLIVSIRTVAAALLAAVISISAPTMGIADGISTPVPQPTPEVQEGSWVSQKWAGISEWGKAKYQNKFDPDRKVEMLTERIRVLEQEKALLQDELAAKELRMSVSEKDLVAFMKATSTLHMLFTTGRAENFMEVIGDATQEAAVGPPE